MCTSINRRQWNATLIGCGISFSFAFLKCKNNAFSKLFSFKTIFLGIFREKFASLLKKKRGVLCYNNSL